MKQTLVLIAPLASRSGYGDHAREIAEYLCQHDEYESTFIVTSWGNNPMNALDNDELITKEILSHITHERPSQNFDICIHLGLPTEFKTMGKFNIGITAGVETDICPASFITGYNRMDLVIVPSQFTRETILSTTHIQNNSELKCETRIEVVPETVDEIFYYENAINSDTINEKLSKIDEEFCFLFVGQWITSTSDDGGRKNVDSLIRTFITTFKDTENPPALILKTNGTNFSCSDRNAIYKRIKTTLNNLILNTDTRPGPSIYLIHGELTREEMGALYNHPKIKCNISHTRGEGFGRPLLEASVSGNPVMASKWSGHLDFLPIKQSILLPGKSIEVGVVNPLFCKGAKWFNVDELKSSELMNKVYSDYPKYKKRATALADTNFKKYSKETIFDTYGDIFNTYIPPQSQEVELKLPYIEKIP